MKTALALATGIFALSLLPAAAEDISEVRVDADLTAADTNVLDRWPTIEDDLQRAIVTALADRRSDSGWIVEVKLNEVSLSGAAMLPEDGEFNTLDGWIYAFPTEDRETIEQQKVRISAVTGTADLPPNTIAVQLPSDDQFYQALLEAFARNAAEFVDRI